METIRITEDNLDEYEELLPGDIAENIGREYFRGIALHKDPDEAAEAALVWEYKNFEEDKDTEAEINWIYAKNQKVGKELFAEYAGEAGENQVTRSFLEMPEDEASLRKILDACGFEIREQESRDVVVCVGELMELPIAKKRSPSHITAINELMVRQFRKGITNCVFHGRKGILEDLEFLPMSWYDEDVSCCVQNDGKVSGFLLVNRMADSRLMVDFLFALEPDARVNLLQMMRFSIRAAAEKYPEDTEVVLRRHNKMTEALIRELFPGKSGKNVLYGERSED